MADDTDNYQRYAAEIDLYKQDAEKWHERSKKIVKLYKDSSNEGGKNKRFNVLWSNVETLRPALYARDPQPQAERRFKDADPIGRVASEVLQRCIEYTVDCQGFGRVMKNAVRDRLLPGRGVVWVRYKPTVKSVQISDDDTEEELQYEQVMADYVYWEDFGHNVARTWDEVWLVWRKVYLDRKKLVKRFGKIGEEVPLDHTPKGVDGDKQGEDVKKACIYECWDSDRGKVVFLSKNFQKIIEETDDPLTLTGTFPCPEPLYATLTTDSLIPTPDYVLYQTQAVEIENLTKRINSLLKALKVAGVYDTSAPELSRLLNEGYENKLIPVDNWSAFAERGGIEGAISFLPIKDISTVLIALYEARQKSKEDLYEITGIADIIRGNSDPNETAKAQQIKGRFAVLRISDSQDEVQRFARDVIRLIGEIIAEHFDLETIKSISGMKLMTADEKQKAQAAMQQHQQVAQQAQQAQQQTPPPPFGEDVQELLGEPTWEEVHGLLSHQVLREFRIDIETDSTIRTDAEADRQERTEFLVAAGGYIKNAIEAAAVAPELMPLLTEMLMFGIRGHRAARNLEPIFESAIKEMSKPKPPKADPEMEKIKAEAAIREKELQAESALKDKELQQSAVIEQQSLVAETQAEQAKQSFQNQQNQQEQILADQRAQREHEREMQFEQWKTRLEVEAKKQIALIDTHAKVQIAKEAAKNKPKEPAK